MSTSLTALYQDSYSAQEASSSTPSPHGHEHEENKQRIPSPQASETGSEESQEDRKASIRACFVGEVTFLLLMLLLLFGIQEALSPNVSSSHSTSPPKTSTQTAKQSEQKQKTPKKTASTSSYSYLGQVNKSVPEVKPTEHTSGRAASKRSTSEPSGHGAKGEGNSPTKKEGHIPELTINVSSDRMVEIAQRFDYQLVAVGKRPSDSTGRILGKVNGWRLRPIDSTTVSQYATRARKAQPHPDYERIRNRIGRNLMEYSPRDIQLQYLVPKAVEKRFVEKQMDAIKRRGLSPTRVAQMEASYEGHSIRITNIKMKSES